MKNLIIASTSTVHGSGYLVYILEELATLFSETEEILFIPYARPSGISHDQYNEIAQKAFSKIDKKVVGLHTFKNPKEAIAKSNGIFTGGGNTFLLVKQLLEKQIIEPLKDVIDSGTPYLGTSAGSNICGVNIQTTNDMPIVYPPSFKTLGVVPFNINPHYLDPDPTSKHMGETRETRIKEFHTQNEIPVVGLREGSWLRVINDSIELQGTLSARVFEKDKDPYEIPSGTKIDYF